MGTRAREAARSSSTKGHFFDPRSQTQQTRIAGGATTPTNTAHMHTQDTHNILFSPQSILKRSLSNGQLDLLAAEAQETASYRPRAQSTPKPRPKALTFALQEKSQALSIQAMQTTEVKKDVVGLERKHSATMLVSPTEKASIHKKPASPSDAFQHNHSTHNTVVTPTSAAKKGNQLKAQKRPAQSSVSADKLSANKAAKRATMMKITSATPATNARYSSGTAASQGKAKEVSRAPVASSGNTPKSNQKPTPTRKTNASIPVTSSSMPMSSKFATTNGSSIIRASIAPEEEEQYAGQEVDESLNKTHYAEEILRVVAQCDNHHSPKNTQPNPSMTAVSTKPVNYDILFDEANDSLSAIEGNQSLLSTLAGNMDDLLSQNMLSFQASIDTQQTQNTLEAAAAALEEEEEGNDEEDEEEEERPAVLTVMPQPRTTTLMLDTHSYDNAEDLSIVQPATYSPHNLSNVSTFSNVSHYLLLLFVSHF